MPLTDYLRRLGYSFLIVAGFGLLAGVAVDALSGHGRRILVHLVVFAMGIAIASFWQYLAGRSVDWRRRATTRHHLPPAESRRFMLLQPLVASAAVLAVAVVLMQVMGILMWILFGGTSVVGWPLALGFGGSWGAYNIGGAAKARDFERRRRDRLFVTRPSSGLPLMKCVVIVRDYGRAEVRPAGGNGASSPHSELRTTANPYI